MHAISNPVKEILQSKHVMYSIVQVAHLDREVIAVLSKYKTFRYHL